MIGLMELVERVERHQMWEPRPCTDRDCNLYGFQHVTDECAYYIETPEEL